MIVEKCPFCLGAEQELMGRSGPFISGTQWRVECECGAKGPRRPDKWEAIAAWNVPGEMLEQAQRRRAA